MELQYKKYSPEYKNQVIDLLDNLWHFPYEEKLAYFKWKFEDNPYTDEVLGFVALDGDRVIAYRGYMIIPIVYQNSEYLCASLADTVTHPDYRRKGIFAAITKFSIDEIMKDGRFLISTNSSSGGKTMGGYLKLGWRPFSEREHLLRFNMWGLVNKFIKHKKFDPIIDLEYNSRKDFHFILTRENRPSDIVSIQYDYFRISHKRDKDFYSWRFGNPHNKFLFAYVYDMKGELLAYIAFSGILGGKFDIVDFNCKDKTYLKLLLKWVCKNVHPYYVSLWTVGKNNCIYKNKYYYGFISLGFILNRLKKFQKPPFLIRGFSEMKDDIIYNADNWDLYKVVADEV